MQQCNSSTNNPYRGRIAKTKANLSVASEHGPPNQNTWNLLPTVQSALPNLSNRQQHCPPNTNRIEQSNDWGDWDVDTTNNGNDSWNWKIDEQPEVQRQHQQFQMQQQHQQHQQQQPQHQQHQQQQPQHHQHRYVPQYGSQSQPPSEPAQERYYTNFNGNQNSDMGIQQGVTDKSLTTQNASRESIPSYMDSFSPYANYSHNQYSVPHMSMSSRPEQPQWPNEQQNMYIQQRAPEIPQRDQTAQPSVTASTYNWNKDPQTTLSEQHWHNHTEVPPKVSNVKKIDQHIDNADNQFSLTVSQQSDAPQPFLGTNDTMRNDNSSNWSTEGQDVMDVQHWQEQNNISRTWQNQNSESSLPSHMSGEVHISDNTVKSWTQPPPISHEQQQQHQQQQPWDNIQSETNQWSHHQQKEKEQLSDETISQSGMATNDKQHIQYSLSQFSSSVPSAPVDTAVNTLSIEHQMDTKRSNMPAITPSLPVDASFSTRISNIGPLPNDIHNGGTDAKNSDNSENALLPNRDINTDVDKESYTNMESELSASISHLSLDNRLGEQSGGIDQSQEKHSATSVKEINKPASSNVDHTVTSGNVTMPLPGSMKANVNNYNPTDNQSLVKQEHSSFEINQGNATAVPENQFGYDQWYNRNTLSAPSEDSRYTQHNENVPKSWTAEQNVENYENIQQSTEFVNLEVVAPSLEERDIYGSRDSINKETLDNDPKPSINPSKDTAIGRQFHQEANNVEVPSAQQPIKAHQSLPPEQTPDNYEFASNDRNTFLETGELTDSHQEHERTPPIQEDENDEVPNDIPFLREVPGQSSTVDPRRNDPTGQEQFAQTGQRLPDPRRNDPSGQEHGPQLRNVPERVERRDVPSGQERGPSVLLRGDSETFERRNDPSGRERSLPPQQSRNNPSGEERVQSQIQTGLNPSEEREVLGRGNELEESSQQSDGELRQIPGGASPSEITQASDNRNSGRIVTGSQEITSVISTCALQDQSGDLRSKREEAVGASMGQTPAISGPLNRRDSYEDEDDERSGNSREDSRERRRDGSPDRRRFERDPDYDDYYYDRRRGADSDRGYNLREDFERREISYREEERKHHSRDDLNRHPRDEVDRKGRTKDEVDDREGRRRPPDDRRRERDDLRRRDREREYDPRYGRDGREYAERDRRRDDRRPRRYDEYDVRDPYRRDYYEDPYGRSSRPSSRSSYNDRDRDYYMRSRDPYYAYNGYGAYDYGAHYGSNYYAYLENLRRTNPEAYSEWYHKYYVNQHPQQHMARAVSSYPEDRASVHSGRSSCDERTTGDKRTLTDASLLEESALISARMTPTKFSTSHTYGCFSIGSLIHVHPSYPADGERAKVDVFRVDNLLLHDPVARELRVYPGPLIKQVGVTHKKTIIEYCENKIKKAATNEELFDRASYILLYELMIMLIQQNGNVVGVDIAALLLRNKDVYPLDMNKTKTQDSYRRGSVLSQRSSITGAEGSTQDLIAAQEKSENLKQRKTVEEVTDEFRNTLLHGLVQEALEYAMNEGLWGHALFLASKLDKRTHASVMTRFANSLSPHDPLQTLYQLHSGRVPTIVTTSTDPRWDDWRPHLAMIISNVSANPEVNRRSVMTLGDTLAVKGDIHAAHFCYILAQVDFCTYGMNSAKLVLIGSNHCKPYSEFMTTEAVMLTEIYEYARNLSEPGFTLTNLQEFKFDLAVKMIDYGLIEKALLYLEQIAVNIVKEPSKYKQSFIKNVYTLGDRIKYHDPVCKNAIEDVANLTWLNKLSEIVGKYQTGELVEDEIYNPATSAECTNVVKNQNAHEVKQLQQSQWNVPHSEYGEGTTSVTDMTSPEIQSNWQPMSLPPDVQETYDDTDQRILNNEESRQYQEPQQPDYWNKQSYYQGNYSRTDDLSVNWQQQSIQQSSYSAEQVDNDNLRQQEQERWNPETDKEEKASTPELPQPTISMAPSTGKQYDPLEELDALEPPTQASKQASENKKAAEKAPEKKSSNGGWFGGLFSKLAPKPKNQMILPDDRNPTIVWDPVAKKWMNKDEDGSSESLSLGPPPKITDMGYRAPPTEIPASHQQLLPGNPQHEEHAASTLNSLTLTPSGGNMFKLPKGRSMRANYIDVMNPGGSKNNSGSSNVPTPVTSPLVPMAASSPQLFIPAPVNDPSAPMDFLTPSTLPSTNAGENAAQGLSRWSSTSSLSREVQSYTMRDPRFLQRNKGPLMFKPSEMKNHPTKDTSQNRYAS